MEMKIIGSKIAEARKKIGISQAELAEQLFISPQAVGKWERGESIPDLITLTIFQKILGPRQKRYLSALWLSHRVSCRL